MRARVDDRGKVLVVNAGASASLVGDSRLNELTRSIELAGLRVVLSSQRCSPSKIRDLTTAEDPSVLILVGFSILSIGHLTQVPRVLRMLPTEPRRLPVLVGATMSVEDERDLRRIGVADVFTIGLGTPLAVAKIRALVRDAG